MTLLTGCGESKDAYQYGQTGAIPTSRIIKRYSEDVILL
jgi:hypothetical protein